MVAVQHAYVDSNRLAFLVTSRRYAESVSGGKLRPQDCELRNCFILSVSRTELEESKSPQLEVERLQLPPFITPHNVQAYLGETLMDFPYAYHFESGRQTEIWKFIWGTPSRWQLLHSLSEDQRSVKEEWKSFGDIIVRVNGDVAVRDNQFRDLDHPIALRIAKEIRKQGGSNVLRVLWCDDHIFVIYKAHESALFENVAFNGSSHFLEFSGPFDMPKVINIGSAPQGIVKAIKVDGMPILVASGFDSTNERHVLSLFDLKNTVSRELYSSLAPISYLSFSDDSILCMERSPLTEIATERMDDTQRSYSLSPRNIVFFDSKSKYTFKLDLGSVFDLDEHGLVPVKNSHVEPLRSYEHSLSTKVEDVHAVPRGTKTSPRDW